MPKTKTDITTVNKKMSTKKINNQNETIIDNKEKIKSKKRHFIINYNNEIMTASPSGERPKQAANKALTAIIKKYNNNNNLINKEIYFTLTERKKQKKDKNGELIPNRIFHYIGTRTKIDVNDPKYTDSQKEIRNGIPIGIKIPHTMFVKCDMCKQKENEMIQEAKNKGDKLTKKNIPRNENCKDCKSVAKFIVYEYTNKVKMAPKENIIQNKEKPKKVTKKQSEKQSEKQPKKQPKKQPILVSEETSEEIVEIPKKLQKKLLKFQKTNN